ncbi:hypothetical protein XENTR_v10000588 [Xenopus tropicalis]|nr:hypothetical protein XENTR_v10000588 [Xenopus tropicalis]
MECLSLLIASDARIDMCNKDGHTAEDVALSCGFLDCARYLATIKLTQDTFSRAQSSLHNLKETAAGVKRGQCCQSISHGKRRRSDGNLNSTLQLDNINIVNCCRTFILGIYWLVRHVL